MSADVERWASDLGRQFSGMMRDVAAVNATMEWPPGRCTVSTLTIGGSFGGTVDVRRLAGGLADGLGGGGVALATSKARRVFFNQVTLKHGASSIKLFSNGSVHVTGCRNALHFVDTVDRVCEAVLACTGEALQLRSAAVHMLNINFSMRRRLPLQVLRGVFAAAGLEANYDPDCKYPGARIKVPVDDGRVVTPCIFKTGSVIIAGARDPRAAAAGYRAVCLAVAGLPTPPVPIDARPASKRVRETYRIVGGYSSHLIDLCVSWDDASCGDDEK